MKKILLLGGSEQQIIAITKAKELGYYTILCDFLPDNPGQHYADKFYLASTTDKELILNIAKKENIDGILAYASDPAAPTAAYVAMKLNLPGNPYESVEILCNKDKFRDFLAKHNFCTPKAKGYSNIVDAINDLNSFKFPIIIKPVDSSGSKGISKATDLINIKDKLEYAMSFSRAKRIIIEEFVEKKGYQIAGDGLSIDGKLVFRYFGNDHFDKDATNPFVPISASFPYNMPKEIHDKIHNEIQRLITLLNMKTCTYNFDMRIDENDNVYLMEIAPRDGGNYIPQIIKHATGIDLVECSIKTAMGEKIILPDNITYNGFYSYYSVHSSVGGVLKSIDIDDDFKNKIIENHLIVKPGDTIKPYTGSNTTLGILILKFDSMNEMLTAMDNGKSWIAISIQL